MNNRTKPVRRAASLKDRLTHGHVVMQNLANINASVVLPARLHRRVLPALPHSSRVFFLHVPKTGGISLGNYLRGLFAADLVCPQPSGDGRWIYTSADVAHYRLFTGHFDVDFIDAVDPCGFKLTILRDPISRIVSLYDFWRSVSLEWADQNLTGAQLNAPRFSRGHTFGAFLRTDNAFVRAAIENTTARQLLGRRFEDVANDSVAAAQAAFARLRTFEWYTTTENLTAALPALAAQMGTPVPTELHVHRTYAPEPDEPRMSVLRTSPMAADLRYCTQINQIDLRLYRLVSEAAATCSSFSDVAARFFRRFLPAARSDPTTPRDATQSAIALGGTLAAREKCSCANS